jgi:replicative DNA helicase
MNERYEFSAEFQLALIAAIIRDETFLRRYHDVLKAEYFSHPQCQAVMRLIQTHFHTYHHAPGTTAFINMIEEDLKRHPPDEAARRNWTRFIRQVTEDEVRDMRYVQDTAVQWARDRVLEQYVIECAALVDEARKTGERNYEQMRLKLQEAMSVGLGRGDPNADYFSSSMQRLATYQLDQGTKIPTFLGPVDRVLGGGCDRGEEIVIAAPTSRGKTSMLIQLGMVGPLFAGARVVAVSVEMSQLKFQQRMDRCLTYMTRTEIEEDPERAFDQIEFVRKFRGNARVYEYPGRNCSVDTIFSLLEDLKNREGFVADALVVDYGSIMRPTRAYRDKRHELASIYRELRDLAKETNVALWTAAQTNRGSFTKAIVNMSDLAECWEIAQIVDGMFCICQTPTEREEHRVRLHTAKLRDAEDHQTFPLIFNRSVSRFEDAERVYALD